MGGGQRDGPLRALYPKLPEVQEPLWLVRPVGGVGGGHAGPQSFQLPCLGRELSAKRSPRRHLSPFHSDLQSGNFFEDWRVWRHRFWASWYQLLLQPSYLQRFLPPAVDDAHQPSPAISSRFWYHGDSAAGAYGEFSASKHGVLRLMSHELGANCLAPSIPWLLFGGQIGGLNVRMGRKLVTEIQSVPKVISTLQYS